MLTAETRRRLVIIGMFLVPVALVKATAVFYGSGSPAGAEAASVSLTPVDPSVASDRSPTLSAAESEAADRIAELYQQPVGASPLLHDVRSPEQVDEQPVDPGSPNLLVQAILASEQGNTALINGKMYRVGDVFDGTDWQVREINNTTRSVTIVNTTTGREITRAVKINEQG